MSGHARDNAAKVRRILEDQAGSAVLYRTCVGGPSGQRRQVPVGRVEYADFGQWELAVWCPPGHDCQCDEPAGYLRRGTDARGEWTVYGSGRDGWDGYWLRGWADSPAIGADVLVSGEYAANGNHEHARISRGGWVRHNPVPVTA